jgi:hypothetical protein
MAKSAKSVLPVQDLGGSLHAHVEPRGGGTLVTLSGNVTELADFTPLLRLRGPLLIDLHGIERINSLGVRGWAQFVRECEAAGLDPSFERCSPVMVQQISMIASFMGTGSRVRSLIAPYLCPSCNAEEFQLVDITGGARRAVQPTIPCPKCRTPMQLDELDEMYESLFAKL